jgi:WD40 repeat protein
VGIVALCLLLELTWVAWVRYGAIARDEWIFCLTYSPDGTVVASGGTSSFVRLWDTQSSALIAMLPGHRDYVHAIAFSADGTMLATGDGSGVIRLWTAYKVKTVADETIRAPNGVNALALAPRSPLLACGGERSLAPVELWDMTSKQWVRNIGAHPFDVQAVAFSPDGKLLASGGDDDIVRVWDPTNGKLLNELHTAQSGAVCLAFSPDSKKLATARGKRVTIWDAETGHQDRTFEGLIHTIYCISYSHFGDVVAVAGQVPGKFDKAHQFPGAVELWDSSSGRLRGRVAQDDMRSTRAVAISPVRNECATGGYGLGGAVKFWALDEITRATDSAKARPHESR